MASYRSSRDGGASSTSSSVLNHQPNYYVIYSPFSKEKSKECVLRFPMLTDPKDKNTGWIYDDVFSIVRFLQQMFPEMEQAFTMLMANTDSTTFGSTRSAKQFFDRVNHLVSSVKKMLQGTSDLQNRHLKFENDDFANLLKLAYNAAIDDPENLNHETECFSEERYGETEYKTMDKVVEALQLTENDHFLDLGSGCGQVVLYVAAKIKCKSAVGIEKVYERNQYAKQLQLELLNILRWLNADDDIIDHVEASNLERGDFLEDSSREKIKKSTAIYANNIVYGPKINLELTNIFKELLDDGVRIVCTLSLAGLRERGPSTRNFDDFAYLVDTEKLWAADMSWTSKKIDFTKHIVNRDKYRKVLESIDDPEKLQKLCAEFRRNRPNYREESDTDETVSYLSVTLPHQYHYNQFQRLLRQNGTATNGAPGTSSDYFNLFDTNSDEENADNNNNNNNNETSSPSRRGEGRRHRATDGGGGAMARASRVRRHSDCETLNDTTRRPDSSGNVSAAGGAGGGLRSRLAHASIDDLLGLFSHLQDVTASSLRAGNDGCYDISSKTPYDLLPGECRPQARKLLELATHAHEVLSNPTAELELNSIKEYLQAERMALIYELVRLQSDRSVPRTWEAVTQISLQHLARHGVICHSISAMAEFILGTLVDHVRHFREFERLSASLDERDDATDHIMPEVRELVDDALSHINSAQEELFTHVSGGIAGSSSSSSSSTSTTKLSYFTLNLLNTLLFDAGAITTNFSPIGGMHNNQFRFDSLDHHHRSYASSYLMPLPSMSNFAAVDHDAKLSRRFANNDNVVAGFSLIPPLPMSMRMSTPYFEMRRPTTAMPTAAGRLAPVPPPSVMPRHAIEMTNEIIESRLLARQQQTAAGAAPSSSSSVEKQQQVAAAESQLNEKLSPLLQLSSAVDRAGEKNQLPNYELFQPVCMAVSSQQQRRAKRLLTPPSSVAPVGALVPLAFLKPLLDSAAELANDTAAAGASTAASKRHGSKNRSQAPMMGGSAAAKRRRSNNVLMVGGDGDNAVTVTNQARGPNDKDDTASLASTATAATTTTARKAGKSVVQQARSKKEMSVTPTIEVSDALIQNLPADKNSSTATAAPAAASSTVGRSSMVHDDDEELPPVSAKKMRKSAKVSRTTRPGAAAAAAAADRRNSASARKSGAAKGGDDNDSDYAVEAALVKKASTIGSRGNDADSDADENTSSSTTSADEHADDATDEEEQQSKETLRRATARRPAARSATGRQAQKRRAAASRRGAANKRRRQTAAARGSKKSSAAVDRESGSDDLSSNEIVPKVESNKSDAEQNDDNDNDNDESDDAESVLRVTRSKSTTVRTTNARKMPKRKADELENDDDDDDVAEQQEAEESDEEEAEKSSKSKPPNRRRPGAKRKSRPSTAKSRAAKKEDDAVNPDDDDDADDIEVEIKLDDDDEDGDGDGDENAAPSPTTSDVSPTVPNRGSNNKRGRATTTSNNRRRRPRRSAATTTAQRQRIRAAVRHRREVISREGERHEMQLSDDATLQLSGDESRNSSSAAAVTKTSDSPKPSTTNNKRGSSNASRQKSAGRRGSNAGRSRQSNAAAAAVAERSQQKQSKSASPVPRSFSNHTHTSNGKGDGNASDESTPLPPKLMPGDTAEYANENDDENEGKRATSGRRRSSVTNLERKIASSSRDAAKELLALATSDSPRKTNNSKSILVNAVVTAAVCSSPLSRTTMRNKALLGPYNATANGGGGITSPSHGPRLANMKNKQGAAGADVAAEIIDSLRDGANNTKSAAVDADLLNKGTSDSATSPHFSDITPVASDEDVEITMNESSSSSLRRKRSGASTDNGRLPNGKLATPKQRSKNPLLTNGSENVAAAPEKALNSSTDDGSVMSIVRNEIGNGLENGGAFPPKITSSGKSAAETDAVVVVAAAAAAAPISPTSAAVTTKRQVLPLPMLPPLNFGTSAAAAAAATPASAGTIPGNTMMAASSNQLGPTIANVLVPHKHAAAAAVPAAVSDHAIPHGNNNGSSSAMGTAASMLRAANVRSSGHADMSGGVGGNNNIAASYSGSSNKPLGRPVQPPPPQQQPLLPTPHYSAAAAAAVHADNLRMQTSSSNNNNKQSFHHQSTTPASSTNTTTNQSSSNSSSSSSKQSRPRKAPKARGGGANSSPPPPSAAAAAATPLSSSYAYPGSTLADGNNNDVWVPAGAPGAIARAYGNMATNDSMPLTRSQQQFSSSVASPSGWSSNYCGRYYGGTFWTRRVLRLSLPRQSFLTANVKQVILHNILLLVWRNLNQ